MATNTSNWARGARHSVQRLDPPPRVPESSRGIDRDIVVIEPAGAVGHGEATVGLRLEALSINHGLPIDACRLAVFVDRSARHPGGADPIEPPAAVRLQQSPSQCGKWAGR